MGPRISSPASMFEKVLQAFEEGDVRFSDVQLDLKRLLASEASPLELLEVLRRHELNEPLPQYAHDEVVRLLDEANAEAAAREADWDAAQTETPDSTVDDAETQAASPPAVVWEAGPAHSPRESTHALEERIAAQNAEYEAMSLAYERARDAGSAAAARAIALTAELAAARTALESEQARNRQTGKTLTEQIASLSAREAAVAQMSAALGERDEQLAAVQRDHAKVAAALGAELAATRDALEALQGKAGELDRALAEKAALNEAAQARGEESLRESERYQAELSTVRDSLAAREKTLSQLRRSLSEREMQLAELQKEHAKKVPELEARIKVLEAELQSVRTRVAALTSELKESREAAAALNAQRKRGESHLIAVRTKLEAVQIQSSSYLEQLRTREWRLGFEQNRFLEVDAAAADVPTAPVAPASRPAPAATLAATPAARVYFAPADAPLPTADSRMDKRPSSRRGRRWPLHANVRTIGVGAAILLFVVIGWSLIHHAPAQSPAPAKATAAAATVLPMPGTVIRDCPTCPTLTVLPPGRFKQGSAPAESGATAFEKPLHWVVIRRPFALSTNAVTVDEFREFIAATDRKVQGCDTYDGEWRHRPESNWDNPGFAQTGSHPVTCVSWNDAEAYAAWLSEKTGHRYRLPSASEWEYAARAGSDAAQPWNAQGTDACADANVADASAARRYPGWAVFACDDGYVYTSPVGSFKASPFGLNDMLGNVFQWTEDCWHADYTGAPIDGSARTDGDCSERELRGGSWFSTPAYVRADYRNHFAADYRTNSVGIRLARDLSP